MRIVVGFNELLWGPAPKFGAKSVLRAGVAGAFVRGRRTRQVGERVSTPKGVNNGVTASLNTLRSYVGTAA